MKKAKEIVNQIANSVMDIISIVLGCTIAFTIPLIMIELLIKGYDSGGVKNMEVEQQIVFIILALWMFDLIARPIVSDILKTNIDRSRKLFAWQPFKNKGDEVDHAERNANEATQ